MLRLVCKSLLNRFTTTTLTVISIAASVALIFSIEQIHSGTKKSFASSASGIDLLVGARTDPISLLLHSVFYLGFPNHNISAYALERIAAYPEVKTAIPISVGDSYYGFKVVGTTLEYFTARKQQILSLTKGKYFTHMLEVVIGSQVAKVTNLKLGDKIKLAHGVAETTFIAHDDAEFKVAGILQKSNTPADRLLFIPIEAMAHLHRDDNKAESDEHEKHSEHDEHEKHSEHDEHEKHSEHDEHETLDVSALLLVLKNKVSILHLQREINSNEHEALTAIIPAVSLHSLWQVLGIAERSFSLISILVLLVSLLGMTISLFASLQERRREMSILRAVGASSTHVFTLLMLEAILIAVVGMILGISLSYATLWALKPMLEYKLGLMLYLHLPAWQALGYSLIIFLCSLLAGVLPACQAYKNSLADGLTIKI